ncbi:MAG: class I SAM-dependent methyltransferase [Rhodobacter sp.]|nr:class I SAM-dependent methyltransferase [Rhodobacter sp.]
MQSTTRHHPAQPFWDKVAPNYARKPVADPSAYEAKLARVRALLRPTDDVLEIGCGTGSTAQRLAPVVTRYTATDGSSGMIEIANTKLERDTPTNVTFHRADASDLIDGHPFDAICAFSLLHLVEDLPQVIARAHQQLKPGGLFISKTVCLKEAALPIRAMVRALTALKIAPKITVLNRADLIGHLQDAGFEIEQTTYFGKKRVTPFIVARKAAA